MKAEATGTIRKTEASIRRSTVLQDATSSIQPTSPIQGNEKLSGRSQPVRKKKARQTARSRISVRASPRSSVPRKRGSPA